MLPSSSRGYFLKNIIKQVGFVKGRKIIFLSAEPMIGVLIHVYKCIEGKNM